MRVRQELLEQYFRYHTIDALAILDSLTIEEIAGLLKNVSLRLASFMASRMERNRAVGCLEMIDAGYNAKIFERLPVPVAEILLRLINENLRKDILDTMPTKIANELKRTLVFPNNTVGSVMQPKVFAIAEDHKVKKILARIKKEKPLLKTNIYVVNREHKLVGYVELKELIMADENKSLHSLTKTNLQKIVATTNIFSIPDEYFSPELNNELAVIDSNGIFLGVLPKEVIVNIRPKSKSLDPHLYKTGSALGELYRIGLASILRDAAD